MTQLQDRQKRIVKPETGKLPKYKACNSCELYGSCFSYRTLRTEMMCGFGEKNCTEVFGNSNPTGYIKKLRTRLS